jgi:hypothetical protein
MNGDYSFAVTIQREVRIIQLQEVLYNQERVSGCKKFFRNKVITMYTPQRINTPSERSRKIPLPTGTNRPIISREPARTCITETIIERVSFRPNHRKISEVRDVCIIRPWIPNTRKKTPRLILNKNIAIDCVRFIQAVYPELEKKSIIVSRSLWILRYMQSSTTFAS